METGEKLGFQGHVVKKAASGTRIADADFILHDAKSLERHLPVAAKHYDRARTHVLLLADDFFDTLILEVRKSLSRMLEQPGRIAGFTRRHRRRKINQPLGIDRKPAHHLECC